MVFCGYCFNQTNFGKYFNAVCKEKIAMLFSKQFMYFYLEMVFILTKLNSENCLVKNLFYSSLNLERFSFSRVYYFFKETYLSVNLI